MTSFDSHFRVSNSRINYINEKKQEDINKINEFIGKYNAESSDKKYQDLKKAIIIIEKENISVDLLDSSKLGNSKEMIEKGVGLLKLLNDYTDRKISNESTATRYKRILQFLNGNIKVLPKALLKELIGKRFTTDSVIKNYFETSS